MTLITILVLISTISFLFFGISCFVTAEMKTEFIRYGLSDKLKLVGTLQIIGALALGLGYLYLPTLAIIGAIGLSILMLFGFGVRLKIKDNFIQSAPSIIFAFLNAYIAFVMIMNN